MRTCEKAPAWVVPFLVCLVGWAYFAVQLIDMRHAALASGF